MKKKFKSLDTINKAFGLDYWSNRINNWDDFPSVNGSINASLISEFAKFQRQLVTDYLAWQASIVREYKRPDQFITQNFDFDWRGYSYGIQPDVDHFAAAKAMDIAGVDIYHPTQDHLTGIEISFGGDMARSMKGGQNYLVMETEAQGFAEWLPYPGQLRLQAFSHLASGADMISYWHWHSIHNSAETYWKGLLSHDFEPNPTYDEAKTIGADFDRLSPKPINLKKKNQVAILFSNEALTGFNAFSFGWGSRETYNDILRPLYDAFYRMNVGVDFVDPTSANIEDYKLIVVPALYAENVSLKDDPFHAGKDNTVKNWMELITPTTAKVLAYYDHPVWGKYAAITQNNYGKGLATYIGCMTSDANTDGIMENVVKAAGLWSADQELKFPLIVKSGVNGQGKVVHYYFNYSAMPSSFTYPHKNGMELLNNTKVTSQDKLEIAAWGVKIIEEK